MKENNNDQVELLKQMIKAMTNSNKQVKLTPKFSRKKKEDMNLLRNTLTLRLKVVLSFFCK